MADQGPQLQPGSTGEVAAALGVSAEKVVRPVVKLRHPGRWVLTAVVLLGLAMLVHSLFSQVQRGGVTQSRFGWDVIWQYFTTSAVLHGLLVTLELTVIAMAAGVVIGVVMAVMRMSEAPVVSSVAWVYIWFFRGTPVFVQLLFWYNISYLFPQVTLGVPFTDITFMTINANTWVTPMVAASLGLGLNEGAYMAEIVRAGINAVDEGQQEAASALGMTRMRALRLVVLPQAMRVIIPPTGNETISMLKTSSLAAVVTVNEVLYSVQQVYARTYETIPMLIVASLWYLIFTSVLTVGQYYLERRYARGALRELPPTPLQKLRRNLLRIRPQGKPEVAA